MPTLRRSKLRCTDNHRRLFSSTAGATLTAHGVFDVLVAYGTGTGVDIADVTLFNPTAAPDPETQRIASLMVIVHDLVDLVGTTSLGTLNAHNIFFHA